MLLQWQFNQFSIDTKPVPIVTSTPSVNLNSSGYGDEISAWSYIIGLSVLTLADSRVFKKSYFCVYMVVCGELNNALLLPTQ